ncbi:MAG TPA: metallophosphoesterase [Polyangiaceae bacterium]|jgi:diadenosine tetraphosphatase ApaH/serine/threonine PP2A family protein phosphatase|nr:metallophosphoesterase [Polyangiaceae bacterium]
MRIGILSDIHANYEALSACLGKLRSEGVDDLYCLGDTVGYGGSPNECADVVRQIAKVTILGNHDAAVAGRMDYSYYYEAARVALDAHVALLSLENMEWLQSLPYTHHLDEIGVQLCHGSPANLEQFDYVFLPEQARECLPIYGDLLPLTLVGHSHLCRVFALTPDDVEELPAKDFVVEEGRKYIVSVGSVGQPRDTDNRASVTLYDSETRKFEFHRVAYDVEAAAESVVRHDLERNFANRLFIGA